MLGLPCCRGDKSNPVSTPTPATTTNKNNHKDPTDSPSRNSHSGDSNNEAPPKQPTDNPSSSLQEDSSVLASLPMPPPPTTTNVRASMDLSRDYSKLKIHANKEPLTFDPNELQSRLQLLQTTPRGVNDPPYNAAFWNAITQHLLPAQNPGLGYPQPPGDDGGYVIRSTKDVLSGESTHLRCKPFLPLAPKQLAEIAQVSLDDCLVELLYATSTGLLQMSWTTVCRRCGANSEIHTKLGDMQSHVTCQMCRGHQVIDALDEMRVVFSLDQCVFYTPFGEFLQCPSSPEAPRMKYFAFYIYSPPTTNNTKWSYLFGFDDAKSQPPLEPGRYRFHDVFGRNGEFFVEVERNATDTDEPQRVLFQTSEMGKGRVVKLEHGRVRMDFWSDQERVMGIWVYKDIPEDDETMYRLPESAREPITSAADLIHLPCFKTLFGDQVVSQKESFSIRRVVLVFTDVVSSTDLYESSGDGRALQQVQDHFQIVFSSFERHGRIVKTIGDAVMGAFTSGDKALYAVAHALDGISQMQMRPDGKPFQIRVGMHAGPALVVPLNGINDYFGRNVNIAARVEATAVGGECLVSDAVLEDPISRAAFDKLREQGYTATREETVSLKGVPQPVSVQGFQSKLSSSSLDA